MDIEEDSSSSSDKKIGDPQSEPNSYTLSNPSRVTNSQLSCLHVASGQRFTPLLANQTSSLALRGFIMLNDESPEDGPTEFVDTSLQSIGDGDNEATPPEPFTWTPPE